VDDQIDADAAKRTNVHEHRRNPPPQRLGNSEELEAAGNNARIGDEMSDRLRWIRSYIVNESDGRTGSICVYQARDEEVRREPGRRIGAPSEDIRKISKP
jgi:hypothetical protein